MSTLAGKAGVSGTAAGAGADARFNIPTGLDVDESGTVLVADSSNHTIRALTPEGVVSTIAGTPGVDGSGDGPGRLARFYYPMDVVAAPTGDIYVADNVNRFIRRIAADGTVSTFAGDGTAGSRDGPRLMASLDSPSGIARDAAGALYVTEVFNHTVRRISPGGEVTTLAGLAPEHGQVDGPGVTARFFYPRQIALGGDGNLYVPDMGNRALRIVSPSGHAKSVSAYVGCPWDVAADARGVMYVADACYHVIHRVEIVGPAGATHSTVFAGAWGEPGTADGPRGAARFNEPRGIALDASGNLYVSDTNNNTIRKIGPDGTVVTWAGAPGAEGSADGGGPEARRRSLVQRCNTARPGRARGRRGR